jgi:hypothetical protein
VTEQQRQCPSGRYWLAGNRAVWVQLMGYGTIWRSRTPRPGSWAGGQFE